MDIELKQQWVNALRSGKYEQGTDALRRDDNDAGIDEYCCLGVLCDIIDPDAWEHTDMGWFWTDRAADYDDTDGEVTRDTYLPYSTSKRVFGDNFNEEVEITVKGVTRKPTRDTAGAVMNDGGMTFEQIADWIEANL